MEISYFLILDGQCIMENPDKEEWNHDGCVEAPHYCYDGLIHVGECQGGVPVSMSAPFFYNGDENLTINKRGTVVLNWRTIMGR